jgi:two-component system chemotaxis response regulator CheB
MPGAFTGEGNVIYRNIVVVGASAGGIPVLQHLIAGLPPMFSASIFVTLHVAAHSPNLLPGILARTAALPVNLAVDREPVIPGHVYVAPADRHLLLEDDHLRVTHAPKENRVRPAIDVLFRSAAYTFGTRVIGIVLSGMLDDGTAGAWAIKDRGGMVIVQSPREAQFASMPESVIRHVSADYILPVAEMPDLLMKLTNEPLTPARSAGPAETLRIETRIALGGNALQEGIMQLGKISPNTCPECQGVLIKMQEGLITRYRCHTGHAYTLRTLLAAINEEVEMTLWSSLRAADERILLLQEMEREARSSNDKATEQHCAELIRNTKAHFDHIRDVVLDYGMFGQDFYAKRSES